MSGDAGGGALRSFGFLAGARALGDVGLFLLLVVISRSFGPDGTGSYGVAVSVAGFLAVVADFGLHPYTIKELAPERYARELPGQILTLRVLLTATAALGFALLVPWLGFDAATQPVLLLVAAQYVLRSVAEGFGAMFVARERADLASALDVSFRALGAGVAIGVASSGGGLTAALLALPVAEALHVAVAARLAHTRVAPLELGADLAALRRMASRARPYALARIFAQVSPRLAVPLLALLAGTTAAGLYHAAYRFVFVLTWIPHFAGVAVFPVAVRRYAASREQATQLYREALGSMVLIGVPATVGLIWIAPGLVSLLFGDEFAGAVFLLRLLAPLVFLVCLSKLMAFFLMACDRVSARTRHEWTAAVVNLIGALALIPVWGAAGAAAASLAAESLLLVLFARELAPVLGPPRCTPRLGIACAGSGAFSAALAALPALPPAGAAAVGAAVYAAVLALFREIRQSEGRVLLGWLRLRA